MARKRPTTIAAYILAAPVDGQPHLRKMHTILRSVAPKAEEAMKWNTPFFVEPRFLFAFSGHKTHLGFMATPSALEPFRKQLTRYETTRMGILKIPYKMPLPEGLIRKIARYRVQELREREDDSFW
jgi:uncharacterized protein YdhG (YjbR/CyaY superfamily)